MREHQATERAALQGDRYLISGLCLLHLEICVILGNAPIASPVVDAVLAGYVNAANGVCSGARPGNGNARE